MIPLAIRAAQGREPALQVFGADYDTPDGTAVRDYIHVCDLADAHVRYLSRGGLSTDVNLGTGTGHSIREVQRAVEEVSGRPLPALVQGRRPGEAEKAFRLLGWEPRFKALESIVETAWRWHSAERMSLAAAICVPPRKRSRRS